MVRICLDTVLSMLYVLDIYRWTGPFTCVEREETPFYIYSRLLILLILKQYLFVSFCLIQL
jgi:hypothetical protein